MKIRTTKKIPNYVITNKIKGRDGRIIDLEPLKEKPKSLLLYLYVKSFLKSYNSEFKKCICTYNELLDTQLLKTTDNTKDNRKAIRKLLNELKESSFISYEVDKANNLVIEVFIIEPQKEKGDYTQIPYSVANNKDIPLILLSAYVSILYHDYQKGYCNPSVSTLAKYSGCSKPTLLKRVEELRKLQLIQVVKSKGGNNKDTNTYYTSNRHIEENGDFFYRLIDVENTRFDDLSKSKKKLVKSKKQENTSIKSILKKQEPQDKSLVGEWQ